MTDADRRAYLDALRGELTQIELEEHALKMRHAATWRKFIRLQRELRGLPPIDDGPEQGGGEKTGSDNGEEQTRPRGGSH